MNDIPLFYAVLTVMLHLSTVGTGVLSLGSDADCCHHYKDTR